MTTICTSWNMTGRNTQWRLFTFLKVLVLSFTLSLTVVFLVATVRTFTFDVSAGLQPGKWENTISISPHISPQQRKDLLENFKGRKTWSLVTLRLWIHHVKEFSTRQVTLADKGHVVNVLFDTEHITNTKSIRIAFFSFIAAIQIPTVSNTDTDLNTDALREFAVLLRRGKRC